MAYHGVSWHILAYVGISLWDVMACYGVTSYGISWIYWPLSMLCKMPSWLQPFFPHDTRGKNNTLEAEKKIFFIVVYMIWCVYNDCHNLQHLSSNKKRGTGQEIGIRSESPRPIPGFRFAGAPSFWPIDIRFIVSRKNQGFPENIYTSSYPIQTKVIYNVLKKCVPSFCMEHLRGPNDVIVQ